MHHPAPDAASCSLPYDDIWQRGFWRMRKQCLQRPRMSLQMPGKASSLLQARNNLGKNADSKNAIFAPPWSMAWTNICITSISFKVIFGINNCIQYKVFLWTICKTDGDWFLRKTGEFAGSCHLSKVPKAWTEDWKEIWMYNLFEFKSGNQIFSPGGQHSFWSACS